MKKLSFPLYLIILVLGPMLHCIAQGKAVFFESELEVSADRWEVVDLKFKIENKPSGNPFDLDFSANFTSESGQELHIPGFYNGDNEYLIRFSGREAGEWSFVTKSSSDGLNGLSGTLTISETPFKSTKGQLMVAPDSPKHFSYENGEPAFPLAFELDWLFALDYDNIRDIPKTRKILSDIQKNGFNHVVMNVYAYDVGWEIDESVPEHYFYGRPEYSVFEGTNESPNFNLLNLQFFNHLDRVIQEMQIMGLDAHLMIYVWNKEVNWPGMYTEADNRYYDYIIKRYQAFSNIVWDVSKEALDYGRCDIPYVDERIERTRALDAYGRLITVHDYEYNSRKPENVDFIAIQSWRTNLYDQMMRAQEKHPDKPVFNIEHGGYERATYKSFEGTYTSPETLLERAYQCLFAGVYASYYWQDAAWNIVIHDALDEGKNFEAPRYDYYIHMTYLFEKYKFAGLETSYPKITTNGRVERNNYSNNGYVLTNHENLFLYQIGAEADRTNIIIENEASRPMRVTWFNPFTGEEISDVQNKWSPWKEMIKPWDNQFAILIVEKL